MNLIAIVFLLAIVGNLAVAFFYLMRDRGGSRRTVTFLSIRVALSIALFAVLMLGYWLGFIPERF